jgi:hypothetical protein
MTAGELDATFFRMVTDWRAGGPGCDAERFDAHARALFAHQIEHNAPYGRFAASRGFSRAQPPATWREIPAVPASAFKDATLATFDIARAELEFHTSGTTAERSGRHYVERAALYEASFLAGFDRFMLDGAPAPLRFLNLVPDPRSHPHSSLGSMIGAVSERRGDGNGAFFLNGDAIEVMGFARALEEAIACGRAVCVTGTAFAFVILLDALEGANRTCSAPPGSLVMETGGFKGRTRAVARDELYAGLTSALGIARERIVAEYGMTELLSQYYDAPETRGDAIRVKVAPPWLRTLVTDAEGNEVAPGETGYLRHVDLANRSSVLAVQTEDRGYARGAGIVLLGRDLDAVARGCSLDAEDLRALA